MQLCDPNSQSCDCSDATLRTELAFLRLPRRAAERHSLRRTNGGMAMTNLDPHLLTRWLASGSALGRRSLLKNCVGVIAGALAGQSSPALAQTVTASSVNFFPGFRRQTVQTSGTTINVLVGGNGPPVLLLHGYPQTHVQWRKSAPELAKNYTLVIPDLRGYGDSSKPPDGDNHINYSKPAMALDQVEVMENLGFRQFA